jgi:hypothetical protein
MASRIGQEVRASDGTIFQLTAYRGHGAFGEVYRAESGAGASIAVKVLPVGAVPTGQELMALLNEMQMATQIDHPNVIRVLFASRDASGPLGPYIAMEYVDGETLQQTIDTNGASLDLAIFRGLAIGITGGAQAINRRLVHRDIKPDNIILVDGVPKIGDFGISKVLGDPTRPETFKGGQHLLYMAPEGWTMETNTHKLDVYSVGIVLYQLLAGVHPLARSVKDPANWQHWRDAHLFEAPDDISAHRAGLPISVRQLVLRMVSKKSAERPDWDEVLSILTSTPSGAEEQAGKSTVARAVEAAVQATSEAEAARLASEKRMEDEAQKDRLYAYSCAQLRKVLDEAVEEFNGLFQGGKILCRDENEVIQRRIPGKSAPREARGVRCNLPGGMGSLLLTFFPRHAAPLRAPSGLIIGGGFMGSDRGSSANVLLYKEGDDDLYGTWRFCFMSIMALVENAAQLAREYDVSRTPFGFRNEQQLWNEILYTNAMHIFTYEFRTDLKEAVASLLQSAVQGAPGIL